MSDSTRDPQALLERARRARPDDATRRRIRAGLDAKLALIAATGVAAGTAAMGTSAAAEGATSVAGAGVAGAGVAGAKAGLFGVSAKIGLAIGFIAVTGAGVHTWLEARAPVAATEVATVVGPAPSEPPREEVVAAVSSASVETAAPIPSAETPSAPPPSLGASPGSGRRDAASIAAEVALLRKAQASLREGDGDASLKAIDALAAKHPDGALREEREAARVLALCAAGRSDDARVEALKFLSRWPSSVQAPRVRSSCAFAAKKP